MIKALGILRMVFMAHGIRQEQNNFAEYLSVKRWLINHKMLLYKHGIKLWEAECWLEIFAFNFDTIETDFDNWMGSYET